MSAGPRTRVAILISGRGSNMVSLIEAAKAPDYPAEIVLVLSNRPEAGGLAHARSVGIPARAIDHTTFSDRATFDAALDAELRAAGVEPWIEPAAGIFLWARLPDGVDAVDLARRAIAEGIVLAPGPVFSTSGGWRDHMRFNVAMSDDQRLYAFLETALSRPLDGATG